MGVSIRAKRKSGKDWTTSPHMGDTWPVHTGTKLLVLIVGGCGGMLGLGSSMDERDCLLEAAQILGNNEA